MAGAVVGGDVAGVSDEDGEGDEVGVDDKEVADVVSVGTTFT